MGRSSKTINRRQWIKRAGLIVPAAFGFPAIIKAAPQLPFSFWKTTAASASLPLFDTSNIAQSVNFSIAGATTASGSFTVGSNSNRLLAAVIGCSWSGTVGTVSMTFNGSSFTRVTNSPGSGSIDDGTGDLAEFYALLAPATGAHTFAITFTQTAFCEVTLVSLYNVNQSTPYGNLTYVSTKGTYTSYPSLSITASSSQMGIDGFCFDHGSATFVSHTGRTNVSNYNGNVGGKDANVSTSRYNGPFSAMDWSGDQAGGSQQCGMAAFLVQGI